MYGKFTWYELMTDDLAGAEAFYKTVAGWTAQPMGNTADGTGYTVFSAGDRGVAGMLELGEERRSAGARPFWLGYIVVEDVDAKLAELTKAGGKVHRPATDVPDMLRFAVVADPQGIPFVIFTPDPRMDAPPPPSANTLGHFGWSELLTGDWEAAFGFYSALFGWTKDMAVDMGPMGTYQTFAAPGGEPIGGMMNKPAEVPGQGHWAYYINVDSIDAAIARFQPAGGKLISGPHEVPGPMYVCQGLDPEGALFSLVSTKR